MSGGHRDFDEGAPWHGRAPLWFWAAAWACLLWNLPGAVTFVMTDLRGHGAAGAPVSGWIAGAQALATWGSLAGSVLMLARLRHAAVAYALSFAGAAGALVWRYAHGAMAQDAGFAPRAMAVLGVILVQLWLTRKMFWRGLLR